MNDFKNMWDFEVKEGVDFPHCSRVHPLMQKRVQELLHELKQDDNIMRVILFGSALEFRCSSYSDLDVYIEKEHAGLPLKKEPVLDCELDLVMDLVHDSKLYKEIDRTGLLLYERDDSYSTAKLRGAES